MMAYVVKRSRNTAAFLAVHFDALHRYHRQLPVLDYAALQRSVDAVRLALTPLV